MARPKNAPKEESIEVVAPDTENTTSVAKIAFVTPEMNQVAFSYYCLNGTWEVVRIPFDAATGTVGKPEKISPCESGAEALTKFKMNVATDLMKRNRQ